MREPLKIFSEIILVIFPTEKYFSIQNKIDNNVSIVCVCLLRLTYNCFMRTFIFEHDKRSIIF